MRPKRAINIFIIFFFVSLLLGSFAFVFKFGFAFGCSGVLLGALGYSGLLWAALA